MKPFDVQSIGIARPAADVYAYLANPANLPRWTSAFAAADASTARLVTPAGEEQIALQTLANASGMTVDWRMTFASGAEAAAYSRVTPNGLDACIYSFVLTAPPAPLEALEGAIASQKAILADELKKLKAILEAE